MALQTPAEDEDGDPNVPGAGAPGMAQVRALVASGDIPGAERTLREMAGGGGATFAVSRQLTRILLRQQKLDDALVVARDAAKRFAENPDSLAMLATLLMRTGKHEESVELLGEGCSAFPDSAGIYLLHGRASLVCGAKDQALASFSKACECAPRSVPERLWKCVALAAAGKTGQAGKMFQRLSGHSGQFETICLSLLAQRSRTDLLGLAEFAVTRCPDSAALRIRFANLLVNSGDPARALAELDPVSETVAATLPQDAAHRLFEIRAAAMKALRNVSGAIAAMEEMHRRRPENQRTLRGLYQLAAESGDGALVRSFNRRLNTIAAKGLPPDFARALTEIRDTCEPVAECTTGLDWAWEIADKAMWSDRDAWRRQIACGSKAGALLLRMWLTDAARNADIDALFAPFDRSALDSLPKDSGCLIAGSHLGPVAAGTHFATTSGRRFRVFGKGGPEAIVGEGPLVRIPSDSNVSQSLREIVREFDSGGMVGFAAELPNIRDSRRLPFLGREIPFSLLAPRLIWRRRVPSLWWQPLWKDGRIVMEIERLPDPETGDTFDSWFPRWSTAYLARLEKVMRGNPENLNLPMSIWQSAGRVLSVSGETVAEGC